MTTQKKVYRKLVDPLEPTLVLSIVRNDVSIPCYSNNRAYDEYLQLTAEGKTLLLAMGEELPDDVEDADLVPTSSAQVG